MEGAEGAARAGVSFSQAGADRRFYCRFRLFDQRLVVEVDGSQHDEPAGLKADSARDAHLRWQGFTVMRVRNVDVLTNTGGVLIDILRALGAFNGDRQ